MYGNEIVLLGRILDVSLDEVVTNSAEPYDQLQLFAYLEERKFASMGTVEQVLLD